MEPTQEAPKKRRFVGKRRLGAQAGTGETALVIASSPIANVPAPAIQEASPELMAAMSALPSNYNFEIEKTIARLKREGSKRVALQFPEGLQVFACTISDILTEFAGVECVILGDVTYGACCVDDYTARALECDALVHYAHSCLVPIQISIDIPHLVATVRLNFKPTQKIALVGTIQFAGAIQQARALLTEYNLTVPQCRPLSPGEILGCTSPTLPEGVYDVLLYVADGRFHLESIMISNPSLVAYKYDPYAKSITFEGYDHAEMKSRRFAAISHAKAGPHSDRDEAASSHTEGENAIHSLIAKSVSGNSLPAYNERARDPTPSRSPRHDTSSSDADGESDLDRMIKSANISDIETVHLQSNLSTANAARSQSPMNDDESLQETNPHKDESNATTTDDTPASENKDVTIGLILGTLGHQGDVNQLNSIRRLIEATGRRTITVLMSEIMPARLNSIKGVHAWVQLACPRLSIDWGDAFAAPLLTAYEAHVAFGGAAWRGGLAYPMDYYARDGGDWAVYPSQRREKLTAQ